MNSSVLVIGGDEFLTTFVGWIRKLVTGTVSASSTTEVVPLIQRQRPDVLILQADHPIQPSIYREIRQQTQLSWIYYIVLEDQPARSRVRPARPNSTEEPTTSSLPYSYGEASYTQGKGREIIVANRVQQLAIAAQVLENGADAYLQLTALQADTRQVSTVGEMEAVIAQQAEQEQRLLRAQIQLGFRQAQEYRELIQTSARLSTVALADPLTEVSNRRALAWELPCQIQNAHAQGTPLSLVMLDLDNFKSVNDQHGHLVGDRVLQILAARIRNRLRVHDKIFRYGGEEFVILLKQTDADTAWLVAQRLRQVVGKQPFNLEQTLTLTVTISLGLSLLRPADDIKGVSLLQRADQNLLIAKSRGRNQVVSD